MKNYSVDLTKKWDYENGFYLTCETGRIGKLMNHLEIYKRIVGLEGDVLEFGVFKGASLVRLASFRDLLEGSAARRVIGFDAFGEFPAGLSLESDREFVDRFERDCGNGISKEELATHLRRKELTNIELVEGDLHETLPLYLERNPSQKIALLHMDVDVYEPTKTVLEQLYPRVVPGGILMLDDYGTVEGETKAVDEFFQGRDVEIHKPPYYHIPAYIIKGG